MRYTDTMVVFREVPDEFTLAINISGCPVHCPGCHSPWLWEEHGEILDKDTLGRLIADNPGITCVSFMGGDADPAFIAELADTARILGLKTCWYSGRSLEEAGNVIPHLDYIKTGPYIRELGPLDSPGTNQRFYRLKDGKADDITYRFFGK